MLRVLAIVDGRAGHDKQTYGIIGALRNYQQVSVIEITVNPFFSAQLKSFLFFLFPFLAPDNKREKESDLIVCTGGKTHFSALYRKRKYRLPVCTCMTPGYGFRWMFDLCFVPKHDRLKKKRNIVHTFGAPNLCRDHGRHQPQTLLLLLGGEDRRSHQWPEQRLLAQIRELLEQENGKKWIISSSPRTPQSTVDKIKNLVAMIPDAVFFEYSQTPAGWVEQQYAKASTVWITSDSISMIYEALSSGCAVGVLSMDWIGKNNKFVQNEQLLLKNGIVISFADWKNGKNCRKLSGFNEAQRCAQTIIEKWWPENSQ